MKSSGPYFTVSSKRRTRCLLLLPSPFWNTTIAYLCWTTQVVVADEHAVSPNAAMPAPANTVKYCRVIACPRSWLGAAWLYQAERWYLYPMRAGSYTIGVRCPCQYASRSTRLTSLPVGVRGRSATKSTDFGHLKCASAER